MSIKSLHQMGWGWPHPDFVQKRLWDAISDFDARHGTIKIHHDAIVENPRNEIDAIVERLGLRPSMYQLRAAYQSIEAYQRMSPKRLARPITSDAVFKTGKPKIIATMLSGNSESLVAQALETSIEWVDEFLLIDTGISDQTASMVKQLAGDKFSVVAYQWNNNFAAARNFSLHAAQARGADWAMTVDSDERFQFDASFSIADLRQLLSSDDSTLAWMLPVRGRHYSKERFIRLPTQLVWRGRTHEALTGFGDNQRKLITQGYFWEPAKPPAAHQHKLERDLAVLLEEVAEKPTNPRWWFYLGQTYEGLHRLEDAASAYLKCASLDGWANESASACFRAAMCLKELGKFREAEHQATLGLARIPRSAELLWLAGFCAFQQGALLRAIEWCELSVQCGDFLHPDLDSRRLRMVFRHEPACFEGPFDVLRFAYHQTGQTEKFETAELHYHRAKRVREKTRVSD